MLLDMSPVARRESRNHRRRCQRSDARGNGQAPM